MINFNEEKQQLQQQLQVQEYQALIRDKQAERLAASIASTRQTRHDLHHYLLTLKTYMNHGETEKLRDSLNQFISNFESSVKTPVCENLLFSAIVRYYMDMAEESGIEFTTSIVLPPALAIKDTDLTVILGNMLENAIEACLRQKRENRSSSKSKAGCREITDSFCNAATATTVRSGSRMKRSCRPSAKAKESVFPQSAPYAQNITAL